MVRSLNNCNGLIKFIIEELNDYKYDVIEFQGDKIEVTTTTLDYIDIGVTKDFLWNEYMNAKAEKVTPNCKMKCSVCGANTFKAGICVRKRGDN